MIETENFLDNLLEIENNQEIFNFRFSYNNFPIWFLVRWDILFKSISQKKNLEKPHYTNKLPVLNTHFSIITDSLRKNPFIYKQNIDLIIFNLSNSFREIKKDNLLFNKEYDYFLEDIDSSILIENFHKKLFEENSLKRLYENKLFYNNIIFLEKFLNFNFDFNLVNFFKDYKIIKAFIKFLKSKKEFDFSEDFYNKIFHSLIKYRNKIEFTSSVYKKLLISLKPKCIMVRAACYGGQNTFLIKTAKDLNIKVIEFQHGAFSKIHPAYNYGQVFFNNKEYQQYLPDYLLTYGEYWNQQIKLPFKKISIGNPYLEEYLKETIKIKELKSNKILIISQGSHSSDFVNLTLELSEKLKDKNFEILFRPHPGEINFKDRYKILLNNSNISICKEEQNILDLINSADYLITMYSTSVFEALPFNKKIILIDNEYSKFYIPEEIGLRFKNSQEIFEFLIKDNKNIYNEINDFKDYLKINWKENYKKFLTEEIGISF